MDRIRHALGALSSTRGLETLRRSLIAGAVAVGALDAWFYRQWNLNPDGVSYFDIGRAVAAQGPEALINGYWSPLYPALIGAGLKLFTPDEDWMYPMVRGLGFVVYLLAVLSFDRLVRVALLDRPATVDSSAWRMPLTLAIAWALFFLLVSQAIGLFLVTPDMGVAAIVFFVAAELHDLAAAPWRTARWIRFGAVLSVGYWWKAILFPVGGVALLIAAGVAWRRRDAMAPWFASGASFALLSFALAVPVSNHVGRPTFGETGRLNQLWFVNHAPTVAGLCISPQGRLDHSRTGTIQAAPIVLKQPRVCAETDRWPQATLPLWYDPSPWYADAAGRFTIRETIAAFRNNLEYVRQALADFAPFAAFAVGAMLLLAAATRTAPGPGTASAILGIVATGAYLLVYVELRHIVPFLLCVTLPMLVAVARNPGRWASGTLLLVAAAVATDTGLRVAQQQRAELAITLHEITRTPTDASSRMQLSARVAQELRRRGLAAGDRVATVNTLWNVDWAQRAGLVVRAYVPELTYPVPQTLVELADPCVRAAFVAALRTQRIRAVVLKTVDVAPSPPWFEPIGDTGYAVYILGITDDASGSGCAPPAIRSSSGTAAR